jgi:hypothetical protein
MYSFLGWSFRKRATSRGTAGSLDERFGVKVVRLLGAAEHRSARIR